MKDKQILVFINIWKHVLQSLENTLLLNELSTLQFTRPTFCSPN